jgi:hypothetical protein
MDTNTDESFTDARGKWIWLKKTGFAKNTLLAWRLQCPWLPKRGSKPGKLTVYEKKCGGAHPRHFFLESELKTITDAIAAPVLRGDRWLTIEESFKEFGLKRWVVEKYALKEQPIFGRVLRSDPRVVSDGRRGVHKKLYWSKDLERLALILSTPHKSVDAWITTPEVTKEFGIHHGTLQHWRNNGCPYLDGKNLTAEDSLIVRSDGRPGDVCKYPRTEIELIAKRRGEKPGARKFKDGDGEWLPQFEAMAATGASSGQLQAWRDESCNHLGRQLRGKEMPLYLYRSKHGPMADVFHADDIRMIARKRKGWADEPAPVITDQRELLEHAKAIREKQSEHMQQGERSEKKLDELPLILSRNNKTILKKKRRPGEPKRGPIGATMQEMLADKKRVEDWLTRGVSQDEFDNSRGDDIGTTKAAAKRHNTDARRGKISRTQLYDTV